MRFRQLIGLGKYIFHPRNPICEWVFIGVTLANRYPASTCLKIGFSSKQRSAGFEQYAYISVAISGFRMWCARPRVSAEKKDNINDTLEDAGVVVPEGVLSSIKDFTDDQKLQREHNEALRIKIERWDAAPKALVDAPSDAPNI
ncbi:uncharacterized protein AtWU_00806 [Aspergillus tubingensis]|uniref:Uncharacterized protein n=1 Tax=Aspergillus niger TaxID=5061 RepID=A0A117E0S2_ASPNG|nr:uncharacterized protein AtWU_00806 [Aspergillus tubingensis]GAQ42905.1 hypothetical protein ABL_05566 [Aspergillus niger]GFN11010.1 hypothetical protein AtWU_00806 [Aspergillus tubingensis]